MTESPPINSRDRNWSVLASYVVVLSMLICFAELMIQFLRWLIPGWNAEGAVIVCASVALEAFFSHWLIKRLPTAQRQTIYFRVTEWIILLVTLKLFIELRAGPASFWNNILLWPVQFPANILTKDFLLTTLPVFATWQASNLFATDLSLLGVEDAIFLDERLKSTTVRNLILQHYLTIGMAAVILTGIQAQDKFPIASRPPSNEAVPATVAYFVLGLILISIIRYASLETTWQQAKVDIPAQIPQRWFGYSAIIFGVLVALTVWLPTHSGMDLFATFTVLINAITWGILAIYTVIVFLFSLIGRLFFNSDEPIQEQTIPEAMLPEKLSASSSTTFNWNLIISLAFWTILIILAIIALRQYLFFNRNLAEELKHLKLLDWLRKGWEQFKAYFRKANKSMGTFIQNSLRRLRNADAISARPDEWKYISPRRLGPRQKILFYYLALVRRGKEAGLPRQDGQTPYEYARSLNTAVKEGEEKEDIEALTASFVEARYSRHDISAKEARRAETLWETIRRALREIRKYRWENKLKDD